MADKLQIQRYNWQTARHELIPVGPALQKSLQEILDIMLGRRSPWEDDPIRFEAQRRRWQDVFLTAPSVLEVEVDATKAAAEELYTLGVDVGVIAQYLKISEAAVNALLGLAAIA